MKVLLIYPLDREFMPPSMPPMGLAYIASMLKKDGHDVTVVDLNSERDMTSSELSDVILKRKFSLIGISSIITQYKKVKYLGKLIKSLASDIPLLMGGTGPTSIPEAYLRNCSADIVCIGEGEETVKNIVSAIQHHQPLENCQGIAFTKNGGVIVRTPDSEVIADIDNLPFPAWDIFNSMDVYIENYLFRNGRKRGIGILSSRGCSGRCNYCLCNLGRKIRARCVESIFEEIGMYVRKYNVNHIHFIDDTLIATSKRIGEICERFKEFKNLTWSANVRVDLVSQNMLKNMADANCISLAYGIESGSPLVLKYMRKGVTPKRASDAIRWTRDAGISMRTYFMIGMPCETPETIKETVRFCKDNLVGGEFFFATPFPGTELYRYAKEAGFFHNEDLYLELVGEVRDFLVNLTSMSNEELFTLKEDAEEEIKEYLRKHNIPVSSSIGKFPRETVANLPKF